MGGVGWGGGAGAGGWWGVHMSPPSRDAWAGHSCACRVGGRWKLPRVGSSTSPSVCLARALAWSQGSQTRVLPSSCSYFPASLVH